MIEMVKAIAAAGPPGEAAPEGAAQHVAEPQQASRGEPVGVVTAPVDVELAAAEPAVEVAPEAAAPEPPRHEAAPVAVLAMADPLDDFVPEVMEEGAWA